MWHMVLSERDVVPVLHQSQVAPTIIQLISTVDANSSHSMRPEQLLKMAMAAAELPVTSGDPVYSGTTSLGTGPSDRAAAAAAAEMLHIQCLKNTGAQCRNVLH